jgi:lipoate-protein ligase B
VKKCFLLQLGEIDYPQALKIQEKVSRSKDDFLILLEHPSTFTIGRAGGLGNILISKQEMDEMGVQVYEVDRGGDVTYHGPGQLVGYPILNLERYKKDLHWYITSLEEVLIRLLRKYDIHAGRKKGYRGVWIRGKKIGFIGVRVKRWRTTHGFSLNVNPTLKYFSMINPCGAWIKITSITKILSREIELSSLRKTLVEEFSRIFEVKIEEISLQSLKLKF